MYRRYKIKDFSKEQALANIPAPGPSAVKEVGGLAGDGYMMGEYRDNISNIYLVIGSFGHLVIWSFGHLLIRSLGHFHRYIHTIFGHYQDKKRHVITVTGPALGLTI